MASVNMKDKIIGVLMLVGLVAVGSVMIIGAVRVMIIGAVRVMIIGAVRDREQQDRITERAASMCWPQAVITTFSKQGQNVVICATPDGGYVDKNLE